MTTNSPGPQKVVIEGTPEFTVKGIPTSFQMIAWLVGTALFIIGSILGGGHFIIAKSIQTLDAQIEARSTRSVADLKEEIGKSVAKLNERESYTRYVVRRVLTSSNLPQDEKDQMAKRLDEFDSVKSVLQSTPEHKDQRSVESLVNNKQIAPREVSQFNLDGKVRAQIRYFELLDPNLDLSEIDLYSEGDDQCRSKVLEVPGVDGVVQACETHLDSTNRLELLVIRDAE